MRIVRNDADFYRIDLSPSERRQHYRKRHRRRKAELMEEAVKIE